MIINITKSKIFTHDPAIRFAEKYHLPHKSWHEFWRRYKLLDYSDADLIDFIFAKYGRKLNYMSVSRWIVRGEVYAVANPWIKKGIENVDTKIFGSNEEYVMNELVKPLKYGATKQSDSII